MLAVVESSDDGWDHLKCSVKKLSLTNDRDPQALLTMKSAIEEFARQHKINEFAIKSRLATGLRAAGGVTFKIETLFQLSGTPTSFVSPQAIAKIEKTNLGGLPSTILAYQADAYRAAICRASKS
ncbi:MULTISPECIES: DUF3010 family protein [Brevundimonas]|uniref:DUF3010 family protein n=1 Tax=Brevundimonas TaxID=41275 RepID=UPI0025BFC0D2|nr:MULTISPECIES: DUF3010 family protein [Brevundimonas]